MTSQAKLSVVIATFNRAEILRITLEHLRNQNIEPANFEVIVVDDGSQDHTRQVVDETARSTGLRLEYLHHPNAGPGYSQNRGLEAAAAPFVLLLADDIFLSPEALQWHLAVHEEKPEQNVVVLGRVVQSPLLVQSVFLRKWDPFRFRRFDGQTQLPYYRFWACNISIGRDFVLKAGGFREHRGRGGPQAHEDPELGYRLHKLGMQLFYCTEALGYHHHLVSWESACKRKYEAGLNFAEFQSYVPEPEIALAYHVLRRCTLVDHLRAWTGSRRQYLSPSERNPLSMLGGHFIRGIIFNRLSVPRLWEPLIRGAERNRLLAALVNREMYRGVLFHHFLQGCRDADHKFPAYELSEPPPMKALASRRADSAAVDRPTRFSTPEGAANG
jgi:glycosyltransferase involved in cell wall biosynthesis